MNETQLIETFDVVSFIVGIASIVLSVTSLALSILFYSWGKKENKEISQISIKIDEKVGILDKLFDQLYSKAFDAVKNHGDEIQRILRDTIGLTNVANQKNYDLELYIHLIKPGKHTIKDLASSIGLDESKTKRIVESFYSNPKYSDLGLIIDGDNVICNPKIVDASEDHS